eukprot:jgi/Chlat1/6205/Chrsp44S05801
MASVAAAAAVGVAQTRGAGALKSKAPRPVSAAKPARKVTSMNALGGIGAPGDIPDMNKRNVMNLLMWGAIGLPATGMLGGYVWFLVPPGSGGAGAGITAKDANGDDVTVTKWLKTHPVGDHSLVQGLRGDATYLIVKGDGQLETYGINAVCTHLGCVVPWNAAEKKFICPCHGSQYDGTGKVVRGPAPLSLALANADMVDDKVVFSPWTVEDFRTGQQPWWN